MTTRPGLRSRVVVRGRGRVPIALALVAMLATAIAAAPAAAAQRSITNWKQASGGGYHTCGVTLSGRAYCWGGDPVGQLGNGPGHTASLVPSQVAGAATDWTAISAGGQTTCALKTTGRLFCWGDDSLGQMGDGNGRRSRNVPVEVAGGASDWASVSVGSTSACATKVSGRLYCWGADTFGALGNGGTNQARNTPVEVAGAATNWSEVSVGSEHACARRTTGRLFCWGSDREGQVGDGPSLVNRTSPTPVASGGTSWATLSAGFRHTCGVRTTHELFCWGDDDAAQLGAPGQDTVDRPVPTEVVGNTTDWSSVTGGGGTCARKTDNRVFCWGLSSRGQTGNNSPFPFEPRPVEIAGGITDWASVASGGHHSCAVRAIHTLYCWGYNDWGQIGNGGSAIPWVTVPVQVAP